MNHLIRIIRDGDEVSLKKEINLFELMETKDYINGLMVTAAYGREKFIKYFKNEIGKRSKCGRTALMFAAEYDHVDFITHLQKEIKMEDMYGFSALMMCVVRDSRKFAEQLLKEEEGGLCLRLKRTYGQVYKRDMNALLIAALHKNEFFIKLLLPYEICEVNLSEIDWIYNVTQDDEICNILLNALREHNRKKKISTADLPDKYVGVKSPEDRIFLFDVFTEIDIKGCEIIPYQPPATDYSENNDEDRELKPENLQASQTISPIINHEQTLKQEPEEDVEENRQADISPLKDEQSNNEQEEEESLEPKKDKEKQEEPNTEENEEEILTNEEEIEEVLEEEEEEEQEEIEDEQIEDYEEESEEIEPIGPSPITNSKEESLNIPISPVEREREFIRREMMFQNFSSEHNSTTQTITSNSLTADLDIDAMVMLEHSISKYSDDQENEQVVCSSEQSPKQVLLSSEKSTQTSIVDMISQSIEQSEKENTNELLDIISRLEERVVVLEEFHGNVESNLAFLATVLLVLLPMIATISLLKFISPE